MDAVAIEQLYRSHGHLVVRRARRLLEDEEEAREVLHEVFTALLDRPAQMRDEAAPTTWLYAATTHACLNRLRNQKTHARLLRERPPAEWTAGGLDPESASLLRDLLARMPEDLAQVAVYYYLDEMTHAEIAEVVGCSRRRIGDLVARLHASLHAAETSP